MKNIIKKIIKVSLGVFVGIIALSCMLVSCTDDVSDTVETATVNTNNAQVENAVEEEPVNVEYSIEYKKYNDKITYHKGSLATDGAVKCIVTELSGYGLGIEDEYGNKACIKCDPYSAIPYKIGEKLIVYGYSSVTEKMKYQSKDSSTGQVVEIGTVPIFVTNYIDRIDHTTNNEETNLATKQAIRDRMCGEYESYITGEAFILTPENLFVEGETIPSPLPDKPCYLIKEIYYATDEFDGPSIECTITPLNDKCIITEDAACGLYESPIRVDKQYKTKELDIDTWNYGDYFWAY